jgi:hypothetical protein
MENQNTLNKHGDLIAIISNSLKYDAESIKAILKRNGVNTDLIRTQEQLNRVFIESLAKSKIIAIDFKKYLNDLSKKAELNASGDNADLFKLFDEIEQQEYELEVEEIDAELSKTTTNTKKGFLSGITLDSLISSATKIMELQRDIETSQQSKKEVADAIAEQQREDALSPASKNSKTWVYVSLTLAVLGVATYFLIKRKK